jgi:hypothetical protein
VRNNDVNIWKIQAIQNLSVFLLLAINLTTLYNTADEVQRRLVISVNMELEIKWNEAIGAYFKLLY